MSLSAVVWALACGGESVPLRGAGAESDADVPAAEVEDRDGDGLCDVSEDISGTLPDDPDSDDDGLPDVIEVSYGFDATDPALPAVDQVGYLLARPGASLDFPVRTTVEGDGQGHTGAFRAQNTIYFEATTAEQFLVGSVAVSADPADNVRGIEYDSSRFGSVLGSTRLGFSLRFEFPEDMEPADCARGYPFRYELKGDDGENRGRRQFMLVVGPEGAAADPDRWCPPPVCY